MPIITLSMYAYSKPLFFLVLDVVRLINKSVLFGLKDNSALPEGVAAGSVVMRDAALEHVRVGYRVCHEPVGYHL